MKTTDNKLLPKDLWDIVMDYKYGKYPQNYYKLVVEPVKIIGWSYEYDIICKGRGSYKSKELSNKLHRYFQRIYEWEFYKYYTQ